MRTIWTILLRTAATFIVFAVLQYLIPYYILAGMGILGGIFSLVTGNDRPFALGLILGSLVFAAFAYTMSIYYPN